MANEKYYKSISDKFGNIVRASNLEGISLQERHEHIRNSLTIIKWIPAGGKNSQPDFRPTKGLSLEENGRKVSLAHFDYYEDDDYPWDKYSWEEIEDSARRLVAGWNACIGIKTEALENGVINDLVDLAKLVIAEFGFHEVAEKAKAALSKLEGDKRK